MSMLINKIKEALPKIEVVFLLLLNIVVLPLAANSLIFIFVYSLLYLFFVCALTYKEYKKNGLTSYLILLFPLFFYLLLLLTCRYARFDISLANRIFIAFSLLSFISIGYFLAKYKRFKTKYFFYAFYYILAIYSLINLIATMVNFVPFYGFIYADYSFYYNGEIARESLNYTGVMLLSSGFEFVDLGAYSIYPILLSSSALLLLNNKKMHKFELFSVISFIAIAFFSLLFTISKFTIVFDALCLFALLFIAIYVKYIKTRKTLNIILIILGVVFAVGLIIFIFNAIGNNSLSSFIANNRFTNYLFNDNRFAKAFKDVVYYTNQISWITGFPVSDSLGTFISYPSGNYLFDSLMYNGIFGLLFLIGIFALGYYAIYRLRSAKNINRDMKTILLSIISIYLIYSFLGESPFKLLFGNEVNEFFVQGPFYFILIIIGYSWSLSSAQQSIKENVDA